MLLVRDRVRHIQTQPINRDQPPPSQPHPGVASVPIGRATRSNNAFTGSAPNRARAWKIADLLGALYVWVHPDAHDNPSVNCASTSS